MKAIQLKSFGNADQLYLDDVAPPKVTSNQVLIKVAAAALNRADILQRKGYYPPPKGASDILGLEVSGEVIETGTSATSWLGTSVMGLLSGGGYAEYVAVDQGLILPVPEKISLLDAAGIMEAFITAYQALHWLAQIQPGERVLIHAGASGVGTAGIQLAKVMQAEVWVTASENKHLLCEKLGADHCIDYKKQDFGKVIKPQIPQGVNLIMDFIGAPYFSKNLEILAQDGRLVMQGFMGGTICSKLDLAPILKKRLSILGSTLRSRSLEYRQSLIADFEKHYWKKLQDGKLQAVIDTVFDWHRVKEAHEYMEANGNQGKIILSIK